jgi:hypothetical protein
MIFSALFKLQDFETLLFSEISLADIKHHSITCCFGFRDEPNVTFPAFIIDISL